VKTTLTKITPAVARAMLAANTDNRPLRRNHVANLRASFLRGEYVTTHQGIAFDDKGVLLDGQHRLEAIAGMPEDFCADMLVTTELDRDQAFVAVDVIAAKRSVADVLNTDQHIAQTANYLARVAAGTGSQTPQTIKHIADFIEEDARVLHEHGPRAAKVWSSSGSRAAAIMCMKWHDRDHAKSVYRAMVLADFDAMPPVAKSAYRAGASGRVTSNNMNEVFVRCLKLYNHDYKDLQRLQINDVPSEMARFREKLRKEPALSGFFDNFKGN
jgi:hypothetical protein